MSALDALRREHRLLEKLLDGIESRLGSDEATSFVELKKLLLTLFPALDEHEAIEDAVFENERPALLAEVRRQHREIARLRREALETLRASERFPVERAETLAGDLVRALREHFSTEETRLWPEVLRDKGRSLANSLSLRVRRMVSEMERSLRRREEILDRALRGPGAAREVR